MSDAAFVQRAAKWSRDLTMIRSRGPGDVESVMRSIERDYGVDYWVQWRLRYRLNQIKDIGVSVYVRLQNAWDAEREHQMRLLRNDIPKTEAIRGPDDPAVVAAKAVAFENEGEG